MAGGTVDGRKGQRELERKGDSAENRTKKKKIPGKGIPTDSKRYVSKVRKGG